MAWWPSTWLWRRSAAGRVVDAVPTRDHGVDQGQQLAAGPVRSGPLGQVDQRLVPELTRLVIQHIDAAS
jgi:hypothetical protein